MLKASLPSPLPHSLKANLTTWPCRSLPKNGKKNKQTINEKPLMFVCTTASRPFPQSSTHTKQFRNYTIYLWTSLRLEMWGALTRPLCPMRTGNVMSPYTQKPHHQTKLWEPKLKGTSWGCIRMPKHPCKHKFVISQMSHAKKGSSAYNI